MKGVEKIVEKIAVEVTEGLESVEKVLGTQMALIQNVMASIAELRKILEENKEASASALSSLELFKENMTLLEQSNLQLKEDATKLKLIVASQPMILAFAVRENGEDASEEDDEEEDTSEEDDEEEDATEEDDKEDDNKQGEGAEDDEEDFKKGVESEEDK